MRGCDFFGELLWDVILGLFAVIGRVHLYEKFVIYEKILFEAELERVSFIRHSIFRKIFQSGFELKRILYCCLKRAHYIEVLI